MKKAVRNIGILVMVFIMALIVAVHIGMIDGKSTDGVIEQLDLTSEITSLVLDYEKQNGNNGAITVTLKDTGDETLTTRERNGLLEYNYQGEVSIIGLTGIKSKRVSVTNSEDGRTVVELDDGETVEPFISLEGSGFSD